MENIFYFTGEQIRRDRSLSPAKEKTGNERSKSPLALDGMITVIALTQFAFLSLGVALTKILIHSTTVVPGSIQSLDVLSLRVFLIPVIWTIYATMSVRIDKPPLCTFAARIIRFILAVGSFGFLLAVVFYLPSQLKLPVALPVLR
jgi:hypothetical protein